MIDLIVFDFDSEPNVNIYCSEQEQVSTRSSHLASLVFKSNLESHGFTSDSWTVEEVVENNDIKRIRIEVVDPLTNTVKLSYEKEVTTRLHRQIFFLIVLGEITEEIWFNSALQGYPIRITGLSD